jgi:REP element-mobilizing transposase RayT
LYLLDYFLVTRSPYEGVVSMPRYPRLDAPGTLHHVIARGIEKSPIVRDDHDREAFVARLGDTVQITGTTVYGWALLPNHFHILLRSGDAGLPTFMRRLLTGHAITFNQRHDRHGHLFQNRYKSIVCEEDSYFRELVRYIHLNPLRAGLCSDIAQLERYRWCGHSAIVGKLQYPWQDREYVLSWFGDREYQALTAYRRFVKEGIAQGRRPELVGGGLIRSLGGWAEVQAVRSKGDRVVTDPRVLGTGEFVERLLERDEVRFRRARARSQQPGQVEDLIRQTCAQEGVSLGELRFGGRRRKVVKVRAKLAKRLVGEFGISLADAARCLGVSTSGIAKSLARPEEK